MRLPILVGRTSNPFTLINFLANVQEEKPITLHANACRHLLDIDDLVPVLTPFAGMTRVRETINIPGSEKISVPRLADKIETVCTRKAYSPGMIQVPAMTYRPMQAKQSLSVELII